MAADDTFIDVNVLNAFFPATGFATHDEVATTLVPCLDYDDGGTAEISYWSLIMPGQYDGSSNLEVVIHWKATTWVTAVVTHWDVSFYRIAVDVDSLEAFSFATAQTAEPTIATATGEMDEAVITFTNAQANGIQPNERFILRISRDGGDAQDNLTGDAELIGAEVRLA